MDIKLAERFNIQKYPTLMFFKKQWQIPYNGGRSEQELVAWILKRVGPKETEIACEKIEELLHNHRLSVVYFGDTSKIEYDEVFVPASEHYQLNERYHFYHSSDMECAAKYKANEDPSLVVFKQ